MVDQPSPTGYRFGPFELDLEERALRRNDEVVAVQDLPYRLLAVLAERAPALVTREELRQAIWPPDTHLDVDASLNTAVARVRDALGDDPGKPRYVATVPRRGYKLVAPVERVEAKAAPDRRWTAKTAMAVLAILIALWVGLRQSRAPEPAGNAATNESAGGNPAREHLLIARHHADRRSREGLEKAIASFQSAIVSAGPKASRGRQKS